MSWQTVIMPIISLVLTALISWGAERLIALVNSKVANTKYTKYLTAAIGVVTTAVKTTYQTYVEALKGKDIFDIENQKKAKEKAIKLSVEQLSADTTKWIECNFGNIEYWIDNAIESVIYDLKNSIKRANAGENI